MRLEERCLFSRRGYRPHGLCRIPRRSRRQVKRCCGALVSEFADDEYETISYWDKVRNLNIPSRTANAETDAIYASIGWTCRYRILRNRASNVAQAAEELGIQEEVEGSKESKTLASRNPKSHDLDP